MAPTDKGAALIAIARAAIERALGRDVTADERASWLQEPGACFVTLTRDGELRGCIGSLQAYRPLLDDLKSNARAAAFADPRFPPLSPDELDHIEVEVSLLSPMTPMCFSCEEEALSQLRPGIDGVVLEYGRHRSTFLPQVWDQLPDCQEFMAHLKRKAGLPADFWAPEVKLACYTVNKWKESELC